MAERQRARLIVEVDLDPVLGWGNDPEDWQRMLQHYLRQTAGHYNPTVEVADGVVATPPARCCDLHNRNCEPPSELCCWQCTEAAHPAHADGSACIAPDLSTPPAQTTGGTP